MMQQIVANTCNGLVNNRYKLHVKCLSVMFECFRVYKLNKQKQHIRNSIRGFSVRNN